jgi:hypothetical protein
MPTHPFPNKDAASCPIRPKLLPFIQTRADSAVAGDTTIVQQLGCLTQTLRDVGGWAVWRFEFGMLAQGNGDPAGQERYLMAWIMTSQPGGRRLHLKWHLPGPHDWYNAQVYDVEVNPTSGDAPEGPGRITFETVGNADDTDTWQDGSTSFALDGVPDATWTLLVEGCDPTYGVFGIRTGHACHADILPKIAVNVAPPPRQSFSCAAHEDPRLGDYQNGGLVLEVGCGTSPYGLYVYVWDEPCEPKRACPVGFTDYGFVVAAPSRGWTWEDFRDAVKESMMSYFLTTGRPYLPNFDSATIRVPVSPATRLRDTTWVATDTGSSHDVTFRWLGRSSGDAQILDDTGAPALYATLGKPYDTWPTAMGHVTAPDVPGASSELLRSSGNGCFTLAGLLTVADSNPSGLLVDLRVAAAPRVETIPTTKLAGRCS